MLFRNIANTVTCLIAMASISAVAGKSAQALAISGSTTSLSVNNSGTIGTFSWAGALTGCSTASNATATGVVWMHADLYSSTGAYIAYIDTTLPAFGDGGDNIIEIVQLSGGRKNIIRSNEVDLGPVTASITDDGALAKSLFPSQTCSCVSYGLHLSFSVVLSGTQGNTVGKTLAVPGDLMALVTIPS